MSVRASALKLVPLVVILVALLFFFPGADGGFQATNGPTSTLKECVVGLLLQSMILLVAYTIIGVSHRPASSPLTSLGLVIESSPLAASTSTAPLRC